ncbi:MAG: carotenoid biosynthesis protein [Bacteroidales bacterium]|nr:carotenoid biosynthesis protein [Bacteroidales bacterium]
MFDFQLHKNISEQKTKEFIVIFYLIGLIGFYLPFTKNIFQLLIPFALLMNTLLIAFFHEKWDTAQIIGCLSVIILGYFVEVIGVKTGAIFGHYVYGNSLGIKIFDTPLIIGLNWLFLTYCSYILSAQLTRNTVLQTLLSPTLMLGYDIILEQVAPCVGMWQWLDNRVPLQNYLAWWIIGYLFTLLISTSKVKKTNPIATISFIGQVAFFSGLLVYFKVFGL